MNYWHEVLIPDEGLKLAKMLTSLWPLAATIALSFNSESARYTTGITIQASTLTSSSKKEITSNNDRRNRIYLEMLNINLPIEWRISIEALRSVLMRDWALWNSTTAAAAIFLIQMLPEWKPRTGTTLPCVVTSQHHLHVGICRPLGNVVSLTG